MNGRRAKILFKIAKKAYKAMSPETRYKMIADFDSRTVVDPWGRFWRLVKKNWTRKRMA